jgi:hypothetical protein
MAAARKRDEPASITASLDAPLIGVFVKVDGRDAVRYFVNEDDVEASISDEDVRRAAATFGAWSDLDFDRVLEDRD